MALYLNCWTCTLAGMVEYVSNDPCSSKGALQPPLVLLQWMDSPQASL